MRPVAVEAIEKQHVGTEPGLGPGGARGLGFCLKTKPCLLPHVCVYEPKDRLDGTGGAKTVTLAGFHKPGYPIDATDHKL